MVSIFTAALLALKSLTQGKLVRLFIAGLFLNTLVLALLVAGVYWGLHHFVDLGWFDWLLQWGLTGLATLIAYLIYPLLLPLMLSLFDESIAKATESLDYPHIPQPAPPYWPSLAQDVGFTLKVCILNLLVLPLYLLPVVNIVFYYLLNGYLLGRGFFLVVAGRHITRIEAEVMWKKHRLAMIGSGMLIAFCATLPVVNLMTPIWAVVMMTHYFHRNQPRYKAGEQMLIENR